MDALNPTLLTSILNPTDLISTYGPPGLILMIFIESCLFPFLPGDSLLFTAGLLAAEHKYGLNVWFIALSTSIAAVAGNQLGYLIGRRAGPALFSRPDSTFFKREHLEKTHHYFEHHGPKTIVIARFVPIVRTFACIIAGVGRMEYPVFLTYNVIGGVLWGAGVTGLGWVVAKTLGKAINVDHYLLPIVAIVIGISFIPVFLEYFKAKRRLQQIQQPSGHANSVIDDEVTPE